MRKLLLICIIISATYSCATTSELYDWKGYDNAIYSYSKASDEKSEEKLIEIYQKLINNPGGSRQVPPPGVCADYGYMLIKRGKVQEGKQMLERETVLYPESKPFIDRILKRFEEQ